MMDRRFWAGTGNGGEGEGSGENVGDEFGEALGDWEDRKEDFGD